MPIVTVFHGVYCNAERIIDRIVKTSGYRLVDDEEIIAVASRESGIPEGRFKRAFSAKQSIFNPFTHEKERSVAYLRKAMAEIIAEDNLVLVGFAGQIIPRDISHVLRLCLIADMQYRCSFAMKIEGISEDDARKAIRINDENCAAWVNCLWQQNDPWDSFLYDMVIPTNKIDDDEISKTVKNLLSAHMVQATEHSRKRVDDFLLATRVEIALVKEGHSAEVKACDGAVFITINKHVLLLSRLEEELKKIALSVAGVRSVETKVGPGFHQSDIYRKYDFEVPSKVLLVDDEREFVQTLSERLVMRDLGTAVAYDGESALQVVRDDEPEVMILDLRMPGIDGIEVLRRVKTNQPDIEVIILTGHGSDTDRETCMNLGAFAYLQKPVDIDELSETIKRAHEQIRNRVSGIRGQESGGKDRE